MSNALVVIGVGGMGKAIARRIGSGSSILLADFNEDLLTEAAAELSGDGFDVHVQTVDVSSRDSVAALARRAAELGAVLQVAHTAGLSPAQAPIGAILNVDLLGVDHTIQEFGKVIAAGGAGVIIASMAGTGVADHLPQDVQQLLTVTPTESLLDLPLLSPESLGNSGAAYGIAKRANQLRMAPASVTWGARGARINSISPGVISTPMGQEELAGESGERMRQMIDSSGTGRIGTPSDIAEAVAFLLGPNSTFITGTDLLVDGGAIAAMRTSAATQA